MFGLNRAELIGRLGADATINSLPNGGRVANISIATDEGYVDKSTGERVQPRSRQPITTPPPNNATTPCSTPPAPPDSSNPW